MCLTLPLSAPQRGGLLADSVPRLCSHPLPAHAHTQRTHPTHCAWAADAAQGLSCPLLSSSSTDVSWTCPLPISARTSWKVGAGVPAGDFLQEREARAKNRSAEKSRGHSLRVLGDAHSRSRGWQSVMGWRNQGTTRSPLSVPWGKGQPGEALLLAWASGHLATLGLGLPVDAMEEGPSQLSLRPPAQSASVPPSATQVPRHSIDELTHGKDPGVGQAGSKAPRACPLGACQLRPGQRELRGTASVRGQEADTSAPQALTAQPQAS